MWFAAQLYKAGKITARQFADAAVEHLSRRPVLGELAIRNEQMTITESMQTLAAQVDLPGKSFGELAVELGFLSADDIPVLLAQQAESAPSMGEILVEQGAITEDDLKEDLRGVRAQLGE